MRDTWNPDIYERFKTHRSQPFYDLVKMVRRGEGMRVLDLGCGTGELTKYLHSAVAARETVGVDASENMLAKARGFEANGLRFKLSRIEEELEELGQGNFDLVFSNSALQWVMEHEVLFEQLLGKLQPGGQLAVQVPAMEEEAVHVLVAETAREFSEALKGYIQQLEVLTAEEYARLLYKLGFVEQEVRLQVYAHVLPLREAMVEWCRGTLLTAYEQRLDAQTYERFVERYREKLMERLEDEQPFFFPYKRILIWGKKRM
jgi:trans-aconitate 2-methyltransferase